MVVLWESGLRYLLDSQISEYLRVVGLQDVPSTQTLGRYRQRLEVEKNTVEYPKRPRDEDE